MKDVMVLWNSLIEISTANTAINQRLEQLSRKSNMDDSFMDIKLLHSFRFLEVEGFIVWA
jgi:hypothetical protein